MEEQHKQEQERKREMSHDARSVTNYLIQKSVAGNSLLTPLQLNKIVYFCHGWMLGISSRPLFWQYVEAWRLGPVVADVYHSLKYFGGERVSTLVHAPRRETNFSAQEQAVMDRIYAHYSQFDGIQLSTMTHEPGTPWDITWREHGQNHIISNDLIQRYFAARVKNRPDGR